MFSKWKARLHSIYDVHHDDHECHSSAHRATFMYNSLTVLDSCAEALVLTKIAMRCAGRLAGSRKLPRLAKNERG